ncbi:MAG: hypothetical protein AB1427_20870 [Thermodesulfobacteriota bacterium]
MKITIFVVAGFLLIFTFPVAASTWYLMMFEKSNLYSAVIAHRIETTLIKTAADKASVWVRKDFLRPKDYNYPKQPRTNEGHIHTDAFLWEKEHLVVDCATRQITVIDGSYVLANENIEWSSSSHRALQVTPDTISEVVFKLVCSGEQVRSNEEIQLLAQEIENHILTEPRERNRIREENNIPKLQI